MKTTYFGVPNIGAEEIKEITDVIKSNWIGYGSKSIEFEKRINEYIGAKDGMALSSCTAALHLALVLNNVKPGDEIITTSFTFAATSNVIVQTGAIPVFVDINPDTLNIDENLIEDKITSRTKGILVVHFGGLPCNMTAINRIAKQHGLFVIEDAAHALGAEQYGKKIGDSDNLTCFSFYANKNLTTIEGGFLICNDEKKMERAKILRLHGLDNNAWKRYKEKGSLAFEVSEPGYKYNITDIQSAFGLAQLKKFPVAQAARQERARLYDKILADVDGIRVQPKFGLGAVHALHLYTIVIDPRKFKVNRDDLVYELRDNGIFAVVHYKPLHTHKYFKKQFAVAAGSLKNTERAGSNILTLPLLPQLSVKKSKQIALVAKKILQKYLK